MAQARSPESDQPKLTVAVTGPTGDIGRSFLRSLERSNRIGQILAMARRPFDPATHGLHRTEYRQGDVLDRDAVDELVAGADVVVHLAFVIVGGLKETEEVNLKGSLGVFEASVAAGAKRLVYASSVAAYGFHADNPSPLTEDLEPRGTDRHYYSAQKAELERVLDGVIEGSATSAYVFRPCIVAGPDALAMIRMIPYVQARNLLRGSGLSDVIGQALERLPVVKPVLRIPASPSSSFITTMSPRRSERPCSAAASPACTTSPPPASSPCPSSPRRSAGTASRSPPVRSRGWRSSSHGCPRSRHRRSGSRASACQC